MTSALVDPAEAALLARDPSVLDPAAPLVAPAVPAWYDNAVVELGGIILATHVLTGLALRKRGAPGPDEDPEVIAGQAWADVAPLWLQAATPVIRETYGGLASDLTDEELDRIAGAYASSLGGYLSEANAEALADGYDRGLVSGWDQRVAWQRAAAAYGLDKPGMRTFMRQVMAQDGDDIVGAAVQTLLDRLAAERAERVAGNEVWNASQSGLALAWLTLQERGDLPGTIGREWVTDPLEVPCEVCGAMAGTWAPLHEAFTLPDGSQVMGPGAHPNCRCQMELVDRPDDGVSKAKGNDPYDRDKGGRFADREYRTRDVTYAAQVAPEVQAVLDQLKTVTADPFGVRRSDPFGERKGDPFGAPAGGDPFGRSSADAFGVRRATAAEAAILDRAFDLDHAVKSAARKSPRVVHHIFLGGAKREGPKPEPKTLTHYLGVDDLGSFLNDYGADGFDPSVGAVIDFDEINEFQAEQASDWGEEFAGPMAAYAGGSAWDHTYEQVEPGEREWRETVRQALPVWHEAQSKAGSITKALQPFELQAIMWHAGYGGLTHDSDEIRRRIVDNIHDTGTPDRSLSEAYADYVTWGRPDLVGEAGEELARTLAINLNDGEDYELGAIDPRQVLVFEQGFHEQADHLRAQYRIDHVQYRSSLADYGTDAPVGKISLQELYVSPIGSVEDYEAFRDDVEREDSGPLY